MILHNFHRWLFKVYKGISFEKQRWSKRCFHQVQKWSGKSSRKIKKLRTDRGEEYESKPFNSFCEDHEIIHKTTPSYSLESNGVAERKNRTLKEMMIAMLVSSGTPLNLPILHSSFLLRSYFSFLLLY